MLPMTDICLDSVTTKHKYRQQELQQHFSHSWMQETSTWTMQWYEVAGNKHCSSPDCLNTSFFAFNYWISAQGALSKMENRTLLLFFPQFITSGRANKWWWVMEADGSKLLWHEEDSLNRPALAVPFQVNKSSFTCNPWSESMWGCLEKSPGGVLTQFAASCVLWTRSCSSSNTTCCQSNTKEDSSRLYLAEHFSQRLLYLSSNDESSGCD